MKGFLSGFLNDELRDWIAVAGLALAIFQTWLAVKTTHGSNERPPKSKNWSSRYPTSLKVASGGLTASLLFLLVGAAFVLWQIDKPAPTAADNLRQITTVQRITFASVSLWALGYIVGAGAVHVWQKSGTETPRGGRALAMFTLWFGAIVTLCAVIAAVWAIPKGKGSNDPAIAAAAAFALWTVQWTMVTSLVALDVALPKKRRWS